MATINQRDFSEVYRAMGLSGKDYPPALNGTLRGYEMFNLMLDYAVQRWGSVNFYKYNGDWRATISDTASGAGNDKAEALGAAILSQIEWGERRNWETLREVLKRKGD